LVSTCKYCQKPIYWQNITGLWVPFEDKDCIIRHSCRKQQETVTPPPPEIQVEPLKPEEIRVLRRFVQFVKA
jgi:hypothetical protein